MHFLGRSFFTGKSTRIYFYYGYYYDFCSSAKTYCCLLLPDCHVDWGESRVAQCTMGIVGNEKSLLGRSAQKEIIIKKSLIDQNIWGFF